jgi:hypothetical protein
MVSNQQSNLFYLPPCKVIAAGTDRNNLMQAGLQRRDLASIRAEYEQLKKEIEAQLYNVEQTNNNIRQAGLYQQPTDQQVFETFRAFSNNADVSFDVPRRKNVVQAGAGIRQGSVRRQPPNDYQILQTFMEFGGL